MSGFSLCSVRQQTPAGYIFLPVIWKNLGRSGTLDGAESLYQMITEEYARVQAALNAECSAQA